MNIIMFSDNSHEFSISYVGKCEFFVIISFLFALWSVSYVCLYLSE